MMIQSDFKDYYDSCASHGVDLRIQYQRTSKTLNLREVTGPDGQLIKAINAAVARVKEQISPLENKLDLFYVGFCGKIYAGLRASVSTKTGEIRAPGLYFSHSDARYTYKYLWDARDFSESDLDEKFNVRPWMRRKSNNKPEFQITLRKWLEKNSTARVSEQLDLFTEHTLVSFIYLPNTVIINPCLQEYGFQRLVGGVQAFQEIDMFLSGVLGQEARPMIELTDKDRIQAHGFDTHSFRRAPTKRL